jgi:hypothetical protein
MARFVEQGAQPAPRLRCYRCMSSDVFQSADHSSILRPFVWIAIVAFVLGFAGYVAVAPRGGGLEAHPAVAISGEGPVTEA